MNGFLFQLALSDRQIKHDGICLAFKQLIIFACMHEVEIIELKLHTAGTSEYIPKRNNWQVTM